MADSNEVDVEDGDRLYKCGHCGVTSPSINDLKLHMISSHLSDAAAVVEGANLVEVPDGATVVDHVGGDQQQIEVAIPINESQGKWLLTCVQQ